MPKSKSKRSARTTRSAAVIRAPRILEKLPPTESSIKRLEAANNSLLLRIRYGSATRRDASELYTHLALCWTLVPHINEQYEAYERLARGVLFLEAYAFKAALHYTRLRLTRDILKYSLHGNVGPVCTRQRQISSNEWVFHNDAFRSREVHPLPYSAVPVAYAREPVPAA